MKDNLVEIKIKGKLHICTNLSYNLGGYSGFSMEKKSRGYYLSVTPMEIENGMVSFSAFSGYRQIIHEVARKSYKGYEKALEVLLNEKEQLIRNMITAVGLQEGLVMANIEEVIKETLTALKDHQRVVTENV